MKILIIGAGITGLTAGKLLNKNHEVKIIEKNNVPGGIARTRDIDGVSYHVVGGHCFNSKHSDVLDFVFGLIDKSNWHKVTRISKINFGKFEVNYPIEYSVKEIYKYDKELAFQITKDFLSADDNFNYNNLEDWFIKKFGKTLSDIYFLPYNKKIWNADPKTMSHKWVEDKLPMPDKKTFFEGLMEDKQDSMPHSQFYYPNSNNQNSLIDELQNDLDIDYNVDVVSIKKIDGKWIVDEKYIVDKIISTMPLNILPKIIHGVNNEVIDAANKLRYNKVSNVLWETKQTDKTWTYQPLEDSIFHRYIHIGNFFVPQKSYTITETIGEKSYEEMIENGKADPFLVKPVDYNISDHAYVVFDEHREQAVKTIFEYLNKIGLISIGRFGQWEYFNMDICMKQCFDMINNKENNL